jgi:hypothetical protein
MRRRHPVLRLRNSSRESRNIGRRHSNQEKMKNSVITIFVATTLLVATSSGCRKRTNSEEEAPDTSTYHPEATPATQFERDMKYIRDAHFAYVWVFSRRDGKEFTKEDSEALRTNAPGVVDWVTTDSSRKVIGGSNFAIEAPQMAALEKRFKIEDYSGK